MNAWSYSSIKTFEQCPKKYYHLKVAKDVRDFAGPEATYGVAVHKAAEDYIKEGTPVPAKFDFLRPIVENLNRKEGDKHTEIRMGVKKEGKQFEACRFGEKGVWYRGIADLVIVKDNKGWVVDYKTGKNSKYADTKQLDLMAGAVFVHFPQVTKIHAGLAYVVSDEFIPKKYKREELPSYMGVFDHQLERLEVAHETGVWNPVSGPLCGWCPVVSCEHHPKRR